MNSSSTVRDPVCHMDVKPGSYIYEYIGSKYSFCSQQCHDRFIANPHLYIGHPGKPSPKQHGKNIVKRRTLKLEQPIPEKIKIEIETSLNSMMGIKDVTIDKNIIRITYDLLEATAEQIEKTIENNSHNLTVSWAEKLIRAFIHYSEETEIDSLEDQYKNRKSCHE